MADGDETSNDRGWMYSGWKRGKSTDEWYENTKQFLDFAFSAQANVVQDGKIKCPCADCRNYIMKDRDAVELDLCGFGFKRNYSVWTEHGEGRVNRMDHVVDHVDDNDRMDDMVTDLAASDPSLGEQPIESAKAFYRMVDSVKELVHEKTSHSTMSAIARLLTIKSMNNQSESAFNDTLELIHELLPSNSSLPTNFYRSKKLLEGLGMPYHKIHVCRNNCMLYYKENEAKLKCDFCNAPRYKEGSKVAHKVLRYMPITDRLQRMYAHEETAKMMRYHKETPRPDSGMMVSPLAEDIAQNKGGSRNFICTKDYIEKTYGPQQATSMNTYKFMKVGAKKYKESGSNSSIENPKAKKRLDDYEKGLKSAYPEDWQERDLDPAVMYSAGGGMPHGRLVIGDGAFRKSQVAAAAKRSNIKPANSLSYQELLRRNQVLEKREKNYSKHMKFLYANAGFPVPEDLEDDTMEDSDHVNQSSPAIENDGTPLTALTRAAEQSDTPPSPSRQHHTARAREDSPILNE